MTMTSSTLSSVALPAHVEGDTVSELARWLSDQMTKNCTRIVLVQKVGESGNHPVDEWALGELYDARALAQVIYSAGVREAQTLRASVAYGVFALRADRPEPSGRYLFRVDAGQGWLQAANTPDERGILGMLMQHTEASARLSLGHSRGIMEQYERLSEQSYAQQERMLEQAYKRIAILETREIEAIELRDKLQSMARERDLEFLKIEQKNKRTLVMMDNAFKVAPMLFAKLGLNMGAAGGGAPSAPASHDVRVPAAEETPVSPCEDVLAQFMTSLTTEQFSTITGALEPQQMALLSTLYDQVASRMNRSAEAAEAAAVEASQQGQRVPEPAPTPMPAPADATAPAAKKPAGKARARSSNP